MRDQRMSPDDAERLNVLLLQIQAKLSESVGFIQDHDSMKSFESYGRVVPEILATLQTRHSRALGVTSRSCDRNF
jgi:hypothetical protein